VSVTPAPPSNELPAHVGVAVVGSGFAGLATAIGLLREGRRDLVVLERAEELGGTWRDNSYPGCACDVPSHLYSLSYAPNPDWTRSFASQPEIQHYLLRTAREHGVDRYVRYGAELLAARWMEAEQHWHLTTARGTLTADLLVAGTGPLSEPTVPDLPGLETFEGRTFHSASWDHGHDVTGERVAVIGTGASAIQFVPHLQRKAGHLTVFQRTAPWVLPRRDRAITGVERALFRRLPVLQRLARAGIYWGRETWILGFAGNQRMMQVAERQARRFLRRQVRDPQLRARLTPRYRLGCKRVLLSNDYYPALTQPNVDVVTDRIVEVRPHGIVTSGAAGTRTEHPVDTIIFGTGFRVTDPPVAERVVGRDGRSLTEHWAGSGMQAYHGMAVAGFPNFFLLVGPNTGLGHTSIVLMIEAQVRYLLDALRQMDARGLGAVEPRPDVQAAYNARLQEQLAGTVWNAGGCASWYLDRHGRNTTLWPTFTFSFRRELARCDLADYVTEPRTRHRAEVAT
jgi:cation diffusion facilitator CzcD-associated flavoprotein CzcO